MKNTPNSDNMDLEKGGVKFDQDKVRMDLVPPEFSFAVASVLTYGAEKYEPWNFAKGMRTGRILASLQRHADRYRAGEDIDKESGFPHTWMMATNIAMLISCDLRGTLTDDREKSVKSMDAAELLRDMASHFVPEQAE